MSLHMRKTLQLFQVFTCAKSSNPHFSPVGGGKAPKLVYQLPKTPKKTKKKCLHVPRIIPPLSKQMTFQSVWTFLFRLRCLRGAFSFGLSDGRNKDFQSFESIEPIPSQNDSKCSKHHMLLIKTL